MLEVLRKSPVLRVGGNKTVDAQERPAAGEDRCRFSAEGDASDRSRRQRTKPVAFVFGPENGAVSEKLVYEAAREAHAKSYTHLYVIGFAIQPNARTLVDKCADVMGVPGDLRAGHAGPDDGRPAEEHAVEPDLQRVRPAGDRGPHASRAKDGQSDTRSSCSASTCSTRSRWNVTHRSGDDVPAWLLDTDYNGLCFHVSQAFFPRTGAWDDLKKALKGEYEESVWDHLAGTTSAPFEAGEHKQIAVKVIDDRGNELLVVKKLERG